MDIKYIKVGKWYNVPFKVVEIKSGDIHMENGGIKAVCQPSELSEITARQDVRSEHSTVGTLNSVERLEKLWNGMWNVLFDDDCQKYAEDLSKARQNHIKSITPDNENGIKNTETAPKYDPNRMFRKGDKVRVVEWNGRCPQCEGLLGKITTVLRDENYFGVRIQIGDSGESYCTPEPCFLELVTPVEELEPYIVVDAHTHWDVADKNMKTVAMYSKGNHPNAKAAAEAERDRLNAEHRKECEND